MNCNELRDHYELYTIGLADDPERSEIRAHLNRGCEVCMEGMKRARETAALLGATAAPATPPARLRRRILASAGYEQPRGFGWAPALAGALAFSLIACVYFAGRQRDVARELERVTSISRQQNMDLTRMNEAFSIINGADTRVRTFGEGQAKPSGRIFASPSQGVLLIASNLPQAPAGKAYEMWVIPKGGKPLRAGMFQSGSYGTAMHMQLGRLDPNADLVAVTLEDQAGADAPTTTPLFATSIRGVVP
jgi:Anti-sigma-K factor rskA, C-terminal